jgi:Domain of unknown function (DUF3859)
MNNSIDPSGFRLLLQAERVMKSPVDAPPPWVFHASSPREGTMSIPLKILCLSTILAGMPALAALDPISTGPGIVIETVGIYCHVAPQGREEAPQTDLGYIQILVGMPDFSFEQREVPARLGISFGLVAISDRDILQARVETRRPGTAQPDIWYSDFLAGEPALRGFSFDFSHELTPGIWRMEAYEGTDQLYSVEFEVLPGTELPGVSSDCNLMS